MTHFVYHAETFKFIESQNTFGISESQGQRNKDTPMTPDKQNVLKLDQNFSLRLKQSK